MLNKVLNVDYVQCQVCGDVAGKFTKRHMTKHGLTCNEYTTVYGHPTICFVAKENARLNGDWIRRANERGEDLTEYKEKMGKAVSDSIMSNPKERQRRSELAKTTITAWATSDEGRRVSSETAEKTSSRPEILEQRSKQLADWREREPDRFYDECISKMNEHGTSIPEQTLLSWCQSQFPSFDFKGNQQLYSVSYFLINASNRRQIDIMSKSKKVIIEFDGHRHFHEVIGHSRLADIQAKDHELNEGAVKLGYTIIRVGENQWNKGEFIPECFERITEILNSDLSQPILYTIGGINETTTPP